MDYTLRDTLELPTARVVFSVEDSIAVFAMDGKYIDEDDIGKLSDFLEQAVDQRLYRIIADFSKLSRMDRIAWGAFTPLCNLTEQCGGAFAVAGLNENIMYGVESMGLQDILRIYPSSVAAKQYLGTLVR